jgi:DNA (cytosine-5)-methyltransferase 1
VGDTSGGRLSGDDWRRSGQESKDGRAHVADAGYERLHERWQYSNVGKDGHGQGRMECNGAQSWAQTKGEDLANADSAQPQRGRVSSRIHAQHTDTDRRSDSSRWEATQFWLPEPDVGRVAHGVSRRVDRLKSLGNSIVPQVAAQILHAIRTEHDV